MMLAGYAGVLFCAKKDSAGHSRAAKQQNNLFMKDGGIGEWLETVNIVTGSVLFVPASTEECFL